MIWIFSFFLKVKAKNANMQNKRQGHFFIPGCRNGYSNCKKKFSYIKVPTNFGLWERLIPRADKSLSCDNVVSELHF